MKIIMEELLVKIRELSLEDADQALEAAKSAGKSVSMARVVEIFVESNNLKAAVEYLLCVLKDNLSEEADLQTKLFELSILSDPKAADSLLESKKFFYYDRNKVAQLCERAELYERAIENYSDINDIRRVLLVCQGVNPEFLVEHLGSMTNNDILQCLSDLMGTSKPVHLDLVVKTAIKYSEMLTIPVLIQLFEKFESFQGLFMFLESVIQESEDPYVHYKFIESAAKIKNFSVVEMAVRDSRFYNPSSVLDLLKQIGLPDPKPIILLCDKHGYYHELAKYLFKNNQNKFIEVYLFRINPKAAPVVLGTLIDLDADSSYIKNILNSIKSDCPAEALINELEKRSKLEILQSWLEDRQHEGTKDVSIHTALAKIYVNINQNLEFLERNKFYDIKAIGKYCEDRDPSLALKVYNRDWGECDEDVLRVTKRNGMFRVLAKYLVKRKDITLWMNALEDDSRRMVVDRVIAEVSESNDIEEVSMTIKAFMMADMQVELMEMLEGIVCGESDFSKTRNLQNLLMVTAIKNDPARVINYIQKLDNYNALEIADLALKNSKLLEAAFLIYNNSKMHENAMNVLLNNICDLTRASEYAQKISSSPVWNLLGKHFLDNQRLDDAIEAFIKSEDPIYYKEVINAAEQTQCFESLIKFLNHARASGFNNKDIVVDTELAYALAKCGMLPELEDFAKTVTKQVIDVASERLLQENMLEARRILSSALTFNS